MFLVAVIGGAFTAVLALGPREVLDDALWEVYRWLGSDPWAAHLVDRLGGVQDLGNVLLFMPLAAGVAGCVGRRSPPPGS